MPEISPQKKESVIILYFYTQPVNLFSFFMRDVDSLSNSVKDS